MKYFVPVLSIFLIAISCSKEADSPSGPQVTSSTLVVNNVTLRETDDKQIIDIEISIKDSNNKEVSFELSTSEGTAKAGTDYTTISTSRRTIVAGNNSIIESIEILGDLEEEPDEQFTLTLSNISNANVSEKSVSIDIKNDDSYDETSGVLTLTPTVPSTGMTSPTSYPNKKLVWSDEFTKSGINDLDWTFEGGDGCPDLCGWGNNELEFYSNENAKIHDNDFLVIEARREQKDTRSYTSARMISKDKVEVKYGRIDIRAVLPKGQGIWPAIWMLGANIDDVSWPACGEIDIMELVGHEPGKSHSTIHYGNNFDNRRNKGQSYSLSSITDFSEDFHIFSMEWEQNKMDFFVDNIKAFSFSKSQVENSQNYPFNEDFFFILNIAVGGTWPGAPDTSTTFPQQMIIDYIRVFQ